MTWVNNTNSPPVLYCEKGVLKNFAKFTRKHLCQSLFFNKAAVKRVSGTDAFSVNSGKYLGTLILRTPLVATFLTQNYIQGAVVYTGQCK